MFGCENDYHAVVTHFGMLGGLQQLPGLSIQRLMEKGYGFGAEGDWKVAAMVRLMKLMTADIKDAKGTSMMEDYTYNHVIAETAYSDMGRFNNTERRPHPAAQLVLHPFGCPVPDDDLPLDSHTAHDMSIFPVSMRRLIFIHEVHA